MNDQSAVEDFYRAVAKLLRCENHSFQAFPFRRRTRWNNRGPGNGRFPGHGLVRYYGPSTIHVQLAIPPVSGVFTSSEAALQAISKLSDAVVNSERFL